MLAADAAPEPKDLRWDRVRVDLDEVAWTVPEIAGAAQQLVSLVAPVAPDTELLQGQRDHARLSVMRIDVDHCEHDVGEVGSGLGVGDQVIVLGRVELKAAIALQSGVFTPTIVDQRDELANAFRVVAIPAANLILLRVQVLLRPRLSRSRLAELEGRPVAAV